jgi:heterodisulfide reductase subunit A-like polyferredoxin
MEYDVLVVGAGIGGMESALKLGDMGYKVLVVEKEASVGGKMILLSKVFPTLDCASCISTPKMAATIHHPNITVLTYAEVDQIEKADGGRYHARIRQKPRFVDEALCTGCRQCEMACTVAVPDQFNDDMVSRRAAYIAFPQAVPKKAVIERAGTSPCTFNCPAGIKAHGYVSLVRSGLYEEAFHLVGEATPLVGSLGRACYAPCETSCSRGSLEGPLPIRRLKRFVADTHYAAETPHPPKQAPVNGKQVAVVGSGPAGLTAAWQLALHGYGVKIFEAAPEPGGMLRLAIPEYRLPNAVVAQDIANVTALGVEIATNTRVERLEELRQAGFDAVLLATGTHRSITLPAPGGDLPGITTALDFLRAIKMGETADLHGRTVMVVGGGNVAIDAARSARRLGAASVRMVCLESPEEMPAHQWEVDEARQEGVATLNGWGVRTFRGEAALTGAELRRCTAVFDADHRFNPQYDDTVLQNVSCDLAILAIGMTADTATFASLVHTNSNRTVRANPKTLQTDQPWIFAAGDVVSGPSMIAQAVGQGRKAAFMIDQWLQGQDLAAVVFEDPLPEVQPDEVLRRQQQFARRDPLPQAVALDADILGFAELEPPLSEEEALYSAGRCLDCGVCSECHQCLDVCPANAVNLDLRERIVDTEVGAVIVATGFKLFPADLKPQYGYGRYKNVITGMQMDRLLAPTRPYHTVMRPGDGKVPERIAYVMCTGSRDLTVGNPLCSKICCMYSIKQNQLIMGALPLADVTVHYIDMRAVGKGYDEFFEQAKGMGATFIKGRVATITEKPNGNLVLRYEDVDHGGAPAEAEYDLVILAVGIQPAFDASGLFPGGELALDDFGYVDEPDEDLNPGQASSPGLYVAGAAAGAKDIPESILHAGAAVAQVAAHLERVRTPA